MIEKVQVQMEFIFVETYIIYVLYFNLMKYP